LAGCPRKALRRARANTGAAIRADAPSVAPMVITSSTRIMRLPLNPDFWSGPTAKACGKLRSLMHHEVLLWAEVSRTRSKGR
jgi:hypothetical protein